MASSSPSLVANSMANNGSSSGFISMLAEDLSLASGRYVAIAAALAAVFLLLNISTPRLDPREPAAVKPSIPFIGHLIGIIRHQSKYHVLLYRKTRQPIATLPILNGKMYAIWDPALVAAGLRNKDLSFNPFMVSMAKPLFLANDDTCAMILDPKEELLNTFMSSIPPTLLGDNVRSLNSKALELLEGYFGRMEHVTYEPNLWLWIRRLMMAVTAKALFGDGDPFEKDPKLEASLWTFQENLPKLFLGILPSWIAPAGHRARARLQETLKKYYSANHDMDASTAEFVRGRARVLRQFNVDPAEMAKLEIMLPYAASTNTVPTLFWLVTHIFSRPQLVAKLHEEVEPLASRNGGGREVVELDLSDVEGRCPQLVACYRETLRMTNHQTSARRVVRDTILSDGRGNSYLLKANVDVHMSIATSHLTEDVWGPKSSDFDPDRFLDTAVDGSKDRKQAYQPFGGGHHLCPGRNFAFMEIMAVVTTLLLGYNVDSPDGKPWKIPRWAEWSLVDSINKPVNDGEGLGVKISKKSGWESVEWKYKM